jgi:hypothetical protein
MQLDYAPLVPAPYKYFAVVIVGHVLWGLLEWVPLQQLPGEGPGVAHAPVPLPAHVPVPHSLTYVCTASCTSGLLMLPVHA